jgi:hypothetical protein
VIEVVQRESACVFSVRVQPRASRDEIVGEMGGALRVRVTAPPVDDRANAAVCRLLADELKIAVSAVRILAGQRSRNKRVEIRGVTAEQVRRLGEKR